MRRYWLDVWQPGDGAFSGRISVNNGGYRRWNISSETMPMCVGGDWDYGEKKYGVQGSAYLNNDGKSVYFFLSNFFPWSAMDSHHKVEETGTGIFKDIPLKSVVSGTKFSWKIIKIED